MATFVLQIINSVLFMLVLVGLPYLIIIFFRRQKRMEELLSKIEKNIEKGSRNNDLQ